MEMQLMILASFIVIFRLTRGQTNTQTDISQLQENFRTLLDSLTGEDGKKTDAYRSILEREAVREQQAFHTMKEDLHFARQRNVHKQKNVESMNDDSFGGKATVVKREADVRNDTRGASPQVDVSESPEGIMNQTSAKPKVKYQGIPPSVWELGYYTFGMAFNKMRLEMATAYPKYGIEKGYWCLTNGLEKHFALPEDLTESIALFNEIEVQHRDFHFERIKYRAARKIPSYFYTMIAFLSRYEIPDYSRCLSPEDLDVASKLKAGVMKLYGITESSGHEAISWALERFSSSYARIRHGVNDLKATFFNAVRTNDYLPLRLYELGILQAWSFTSDDLKIVNLIRELLNPNVTYEYLPRIYDLEIINKKGERILTRVTLPHIIWNSMHHL